jgi:hypothetical protein
MAFRENPTAANRWAGYRQYPAGLEELDLGLQGNAWASDFGSICRSAEKVQSKL